MSEFSTGEPQGLNDVYGFVMTIEFIPNGVKRRLKLTIDRTEAAEICVNNVNQLEKLLKIN